MNGDVRELMLQEQAEALGDVVLDEPRQPKPGEDVFETARKKGERRNLAEEMTTEALAAEGATGAKGAEEKEFGAD